LSLEINIYLSLLKLNLIDIHVHLLKSQYTSEGLIKMYQPTMQVSPNERPSAEVAAATLKTTGTFAPLPSLPPEGVRPRQASAKLEVRPIRLKMPERH
jgi:hypothetical protein